MICEVSWIEVRCKASNEGFGRQVDEFDKEPFTPNIHLGALPSLVLMNGTR
jgi:hypothetical protein